MFNNSNGNGTPALLLPRRLSRSRPSVHTALTLPRANGWAPAPPKGLFAMHDAQPPQRLGFQLRMEMAAAVYGLGTTGTRMANGAVHLLLRELERIPACLQYLMIDGASPDSIAVGNDHFISTDLHGCGTDPRQGELQFYRHYSEIHRAVDGQMQTISQFDPVIPVCYSPQEALGVWIFGGCGGASGGMLHPMITLVNDVAQQRRVRHLRVHVVLMGPDMPMRDNTRSVHPKQRCVVADTFSGNLVKIIADMCSSVILAETRPDGTTFHMASADRVWSVTVVDQSNGSFQWSTTNELAEMIAWDCFLRIFTQLGKFEEDRVKDLEQLNISARRTLEKE